jgi:hypothetical protein
MERRITIARKNALEAEILRLHAYLAVLTEDVSNYSTVAKNTQEKLRILTQRHQEIEKLEESKRFKRRVLVGLLLYILAWVLIIRATS